MQKVLRVNQAAVESIDVTANDWLIWQLADSAFPTGAFAHSAGLEAAWQCGAIQNGQDLEPAGRTVLLQTTYAALPFVTATLKRPSRFVELDQLHDAMLSNHVANRASRKQGTALISSASQVFDLRRIREPLEMMKPMTSSCHVAPVFGALAHALEMTVDQARGLFLFGTLRSYISAAVRLGLVGPIEAQSIQARLSLNATEMVQRDIGVDSAAQTTPWLDLLQGGQDRLYSRLFQS